MKNSAASIRHIDTAPSAVTAASDRETSVEAGSREADAPHTPGVEQLSLLTVPLDTRARQLPSVAIAPRSVHARFQLSRQTRERGLEHVAQIRRQLEAAKAARESTTSKRMPPRRSVAA